MSPVVGRRPALRAALARTAKAAAQPRAALALLPAASLVFLASVFLRPVAGHSQLWDDWYNNGVSWVAAAVAAWGAWRSARPRAAGLLLSASLVLYSAGSTVWTVAVLPLAEQPYPSPADYLWLCFYPLAGAAIVVMARTWVGGSVLHWVDGVVAALSVAAVGILVSLDPIAHNVTGDVMAVVVNMGYPVGDLLLILLMLTLTAASRRRPPVSWLLLGAALTMWAVSDTVYVFEVAAGSYTPGTIIDAGWLIATTLVALVPWCRHAGAVPAAGVSHRSGLALLLPGTLGVGCLVLLAARAYDEAPLFAWTAALALAAAGARLALTVREVQQLTTVRAEARTDDLTGLGNRRLLGEQLEAAFCDAQRFTLMLMDLDGFKEVNDTLGHEAGDRVLQAISARMRAVVEADSLFRLGGDEFAVLLVEPTDALVELTVAGIREAVGRPVALRDGDPGVAEVSVGVSIGLVTCPDLASRAGEALRMADLAMYHAKRGRLGVAHYRPGLDGGAWSPPTSATLTSSATA